MTLAIRDETSSAMTVAPDPYQQNRQIAHIADWALAADAALGVAEKLVTTSFVPRAYTGKPMEATAAILAGAEVGLSPMASLRAFDNIQGTPAPKAITLRAIVQAAGHDVRIEESTNTLAVVAARRRGDTDWQRSTWTIERARLMGLTSKDQWKSQPTAMLIARATAEVCRWVAADAIMGMAYTAEEIRDGDAPAELETARRVTAEDIEAGDEQSGELPSAADHTYAEVSTVTETQRRRMFALWRDLGYDGDANRAQRLEITTKILGLREPLGSSSDLSAAQADRVIGALGERRSAMRATDGDVLLPSDGGL